LARKIKHNLCLFFRDVLAKDKMLNNKGVYQRYEIEWIGREGLAPETHDAYLKVSLLVNHQYSQKQRGLPKCEPFNNTVCSPQVSLLVSHPYPRKHRVVTERLAFQKLAISPTTHGAYLQ
jgi:hypothetical protein